MNGSEVSVKITGYQKDEDGNENVTSEEFVAQTYFKDGYYYIFARDNESGRSQRYKFNHRMLEVVKNASISTKMTFEKGKCCETMYETPYGSMMLVFETTLVTMCDTLTQTSIEVVYKIKNNGSVISNNRTVVCITK